MYIQGVEGVVVGGGCVCCVVLCVMLCTLCGTLLPSNIDTNSLQAFAYNILKDPSTMNQNQLVPE